MLNLEKITSHLSLPKGIKMPQEKSLFVKASSILPEHKAVQASLPKKSEYCSPFSPVSAVDMPQAKPLSENSIIDFFG